MALAGEGGGGKGKGGGGGGWAGGGGSSSYSYSYSSSPLASGFGGLLKIEKCKVRIANWYACTRRGWVALSVRHFAICSFQFSFFNAWRALAAGDGRLRRGVNDSRTSRRTDRKSVV